MMDRELKEANENKSDMAKKSNWNDDYWLLVVQLYLRKPVGVKPLYSID